MRLALLTTAPIGLTRDDACAIPALRAVGIEPVVRPWDSVGDGRDFDAMLIRSTWDYHERPAAFTAWLDEVARARTPLYNPAPLVRWNLDKRYLLDLERRGVPIVPTVYVDRGQALELEVLLAGRGWSRFVLKPAISAGARRTECFTLSQLDAAQRFAAAVLRDSGLLVQPFVSEVTSQGEWSLLYFGGELSHAVRKWPAAGDFRFHAETGRYVSAPPPRALQRAAEAVLAALPQIPLYARVDWVLPGGEPRLGELEIIEPRLFLMEDAQAPARLARALLRASKKGST